MVVCGQMKSFKDILSNATEVQKIRRLLTRRVLIIVSILVFTAGATSVYAVTQNNNQEIPAAKPAAVHKEKPQTTTKPQETAATEIAGSTESAPAATNAITPAPAAVTKKPATAPTPVTPTPVPETIDFTLNPSVITIPLGAVSPTIQATSSTGQALEWAYVGGTGIFAASNITSNGRLAVYSFTVVASPSLLTPGTYQRNVMGYIPGGQKVIKPLTIIVTEAQP